MAAQSFNGNARTEGVTSDGRRLVDATLVGAKGAASDTIVPSSVGFREVNEVWVKVALTGPSTAPIIPAGFAANSVVRFVGS